MNRGRIVGGFICMAIAGFLVVMNLRSTPEDLMFMVGGINMPWVPPVVLGIVGLILFVDGLQNPPKVSPPSVVDPQKAALNKQLETAAWGAFLILLGGFMFVPQEIIKGGWWSIGVGLIMLGLNLARYLNHLRMSGFTVVLGLLSITGGIADLMGVQGVSGAVLLIVLGAYLMLKPWFDRRQAFGKAEQA
jgi:uncharacterized membrane protein